MIYIGCSSHCSTVWYSTYHETSWCINVSWVLTQPLRSLHDQWLWWQAEKPQRRRTCVRFSPNSPVLVVGMPSRSELCIFVAGLLTQCIMNRVHHLVAFCFGAFPIFSIYCSWVRHHKSTFTQVTCCSHTQIHPGWGWSRQRRCDEDVQHQPVRRPRALMLIQLDRGCGKMIQDDPSKPWGLFRKPLCIDEPHQLLLWRPESLWWINICNGHTRSYYSDQEQQDRLAAVMVKKR